MRALRAFIFFTCLTCLHFFTCLACLHFLRVLRAFIFLSALHALIFYVLYMPLFFTCLHFFKYLYFIYVYANKTETQVNELTYDCSSLLLLNSVIYQRLSSIFTSIKLVSYSAWFSLSIAFNAEKNTWPVERLEHFLEREVKVFYNKA